MTPRTFMQKTPGEAMPVGAEEGHPEDRSTRRFSFSGPPVLRVRSVFPTRDQPPSSPEVEVGAQSSCLVSGFIRSTNCWPGDRSWLPAMAKGNIRLLESGHHVGRKAMI